MSLANCKSILAAVDLSPASATAAKEALVVAKALKSSVVLLHVVHDPAESPGFYHKKKHRKAVQRLSDTASEMMAEYVAEHGLVELAQTMDVPFESQVTPGLPCSQILAAAEAAGSDLIIIGGGKSGLKKFLGGSTVKPLLKKAKVPVLMIKDVKQRKASPNDTPSEKHGDEQSEPNGPQ